MWEDELAEKITERLINEIMSQTQCKTLKVDIAKVIKKFSKERIIRIYLTCKKVNE